MSVNIRKPYSRLRVITPVDPVTRTHRELGNDTDVNNIVARFQRGGVLPQDTRPHFYQDVTNLQQAELTELVERSKAARAELAALQAESDRRNAETQSELAEQARLYQELLKAQEAEQSPT